MPSSIVEFEKNASAAQTSDWAGESHVLIPETSPAERWAAILVFVLSFAYLLLFVRYTSIEPDEGILLQGAQRILRGEVLYRDFFSFLTPGSYYWLALLFKVFGSSFVVARVALALTGSALSLFCYVLARRVCSMQVALLTTGLVTLTCLPFRFLVLHNWDSTLVACAAVYSALRLLETQRWHWAFAMSSLAALTFLFEQSKGAGLILGIVVGLLTLTLLGGQQFLLNKSQITAMALGFALPFASAICYFAAVHGLLAMVSDWLWPLRHYSVANHVPFGYQNFSQATRNLLLGTGSATERIVTLVILVPCFLLPVLPIAALALGVHWTIRSYKTDLSARGAYYILMCAILSGLLVSILVSRDDILHFVYLEPLLALVLAWLMEACDVPGRYWKSARPCLNAFLVVAFLGMSLALLLRMTRATVSLETRRGQVTLPAADTVIPYVQAHVAPGTTILSYPYLPLYYYLTRTHSPGRYDYFQPGMNTPRQATEIISKLESQRVRTVLFESSFPEKIANAWPGTPLKAIANDPVSDYIVQHYRPCRVLKAPSGWRFLFMVRKASACP